MQKDVAALLFDKSGKIKPFHAFQKDVEPVIGKYRKDWLRTEYATAIQRSRIAAQWQQFSDEADVFPNLEWVQSTSAHPGADHQIFWGVIQPVNAPFWDRHRPGDRWNCQCSLRQTDEEPTDIPTTPIDDVSNSPSPGLDNNPGKDGILFNDHHPYFPQSCASCPFAATGKKLFALVGGRKKNCYECILVNDSILNKQKEDEQKQEYIRKSKEIIDNIYNTIGLYTEIPLPIQNNYCTGKLLINKSVRYMLRTHHHSKSIESKEAFFYMLRNPEILHYESSSYVGESKKEDDPKDKKNIRKKLKRKVTSYNYYYFSYNNKEWIIGCEVIKNEFEQPYFISLRKNKKTAPK